MVTDESWRDIKGYEGTYQISEKGNIKNVKTGKKLKNNIGTTGYYQVHLRKEGKPKTHLVHRLVAISFIDNPKMELEVNHIDEDKLNNEVSNLEWVSPKENCNHGTRLERCNGVRRNNTRNTKKVIGVSLDGLQVLEYPSANEAGRNGFDKSTIINCCNRRRGTKTHKGYKWSYAT